MSDNHLLWAKDKIERLEADNARLRAALQVADEAINPPDRGGISMETWNKRLRAATATIRAALEQKQ